MPELPEVEVIVNELRPRLVGRRIVGVQTDWPKYFQLPKAETDFRSCIRGRRINSVSRRAKYILIRLSGDHLLAVHQKISGRLLVGRWVRKLVGRHYSQWQPSRSGDNAPPRGRLFHSGFRVGQRGAVGALGPAEIREGAVRRGAGDPRPARNPRPRAEPLAPEFAFLKFEGLFIRKRGALKQVLMDPTFVAGIGNLYSDEILYVARLHPLTRVEHLETGQLRVLYRSIRTVLRKAIRLGATGNPGPTAPSGATIRSYRCTAARGRGARRDMSSSGSRSAAARLTSAPWSRNCFKQPAQGLGFRLT